jgi:predicted TIM-barrel fold metal-dependent hydrolase
MLPNRRDFLRQAGAAGLAALPLAAPAAAAALPAGAGKAPVARGGLPAGWRKWRKLDAHNHVFTAVHRPGADWTEVEALVEAADLLGIERVFCSRPVTAGVRADIAVVREANDSVLAAMRRYPQRISGYCFVQPGNGPAALDEIERCLDAGMIGEKLYNQYKYTDPVVFPVAERCIARRIPFLGHSGYLTDARARAQQPNISHALDFCALSRRFPELLLILGHLNGGGDWEWALRGLWDCPNVFLDTSGSVQEDDAIGRAVRELGHQRVLFATDGLPETGVGKILSAELSETEREAVLWRNFQGILDRRRP